MRPRFPPEATLSVQRAFVVHFTAAGGPGRRRYSSGVEHLPPGESTHFSSLKGLLKFFERDWNEPAGER